MDSVSVILEALRQIVNPLEEATLTFKDPGKYDNAANLKNNISQFLDALTRGAPVATLVRDLSRTTQSKHDPQALTRSVAAARTFWNEATKGWVDLEKRLNRFAHSAGVKRAGSGSKEDDIDVCEPAEIEKDNEQRARVSRFDIDLRPGEHDPIGSLEHLSYGVRVLERMLSEGILTERDDHYYQTLHDLSHNLSGLMKNLFTQTAHVIKALPAELREAIHMANGVKGYLKYGSELLSMLERTVQAGAQMARTQR